MRLLFITDFTEQFPYRLMRGILDYSKETEPWICFKMSPSYKREIGIKGIAEWAVKWRADIVIGQFDASEDVTEFTKRGIVTFAQDYIYKFDSVPNITADYDMTGAMAARFFSTRGFKNFGFVGYDKACWSVERCKGFVRELASSGIDKVFINETQQIDKLWYSDFDAIREWLEGLPKPIAIMACDDNQGSLILEICKAAGINVPSEVAVIGVDNDEIMCSMTDPPLSSINVDIEKGGYELAAIASQMVREKRFMCEDIVLKPTNVVPRTSSNIFATADDAVLSALQYISDNAYHRISVDDVLGAAHISRRLLEQRFYKETGNTIYQYITMVRMNVFARLLLETKDPISEIAARLDEPDTKSISRRFLAVKGCTPMEFRKRRGQK